MFDLDLARKALEGDREAARQYCGSYKLIRHRDSTSLFRFKGNKLPFLFVEMQTENGKSIYDKDGYLLEQYWSLPIYKNNED